MTFLRITDIDGRSNFRQPSAFTPRLRRLTLFL
jgi:hypothetical protein